MYNAVTTGSNTWEASGMTNQGNPWIGDVYFISAPSDLRCDLSVDFGSGFVLQGHVDFDLTGVVYPFGSQQSGWTNDAAVISGDVEISISSAIPE